MLLAWDTATANVTVAIADEYQVLAHAASDQPMRHGEQLAPLIEQVMGRAGADRGNLTALAVGVGPGPFTGLRVGLVTARTLGFVLDIPVYGVCTLDVIAAEVAADHEGPFLVATDARRKEVYLASYDTGVDEQGAPVAIRLEGPVVTKPAEVATDLPVAGVGPALYPDAFTRPLGVTAPSASWLARVVAMEVAELLDPEPLYLRRPDAVAPGPPKPVS